MESQPQNPEFRHNPENFHPCYLKTWVMKNVPTIAVCPVIIESMSNFLIYC